MIGLILLRFDDSPRVLENQFLHQKVYWMNHSCSPHGERNSIPPSSTQTNHPPYFGTVPYPPPPKKKTNGWNLKNSPLGKGKIIFHNLHGFGFQPLVLLGSHFLPQAKAMTDALLRIGAANPKIFMETGGLGNRMPWTSEFLTTAIG